MANESNDDGWWRFLELCTALKTAEEFDAFFDLFLTFDEKRDLADRYSIVKELLVRDKTQREIADDLQVSISKITRGSNNLKLISNTLKDFLLKQTE